jgi:hypothetical protein
MMDWDNITQTGARASGVEETTPRMAVRYRVHCPDTERDAKWGNGVHGVDANLHVVQGMLGVGLTCAT